MESEPPQRWAATYTKQVKQKRKAYQDGALLLYPSSGRLVLLDDAGDTLESRFLRSSEEISAGAALSFQAHLVDVGEPEDGPATYTSSSAPASAAAGSRNARRGGAARARPPSSGRVFPPRVPRTFVNPSKSHGCGDGGQGEAAGSGRADVAESKFQEWTALYTAQLTQRAKKYHDGLVRLVQIGPQAKQIVLLDEDAQVLCSRHLKSGESIESGKKCHFSNYLVDICEAKNQNKEHTSEESMVHTKPMNGKSTSNKMGMGALSKSQKFISPHKFHDLENTDSEVAASSGKQETDNAEAVSADQPGSLIEADSDFKEWNALYTTQLTQKAKKYHDGIIRLMQIGSHARQIVLLDEYGEELGSRYLKSVESVESGKRFQMPNYLIDVCEFRNQKNEPRHSSKEALSQTGLRNEENTSDKQSGKSKSPKFVSPFKCQDLRKRHWESTTSSNRPQIGPTSSNLDAPPNFNDPWSKSDCNVNRRANCSESAFDIQRATATNPCPAFGQLSSTRDLPQFHDLQAGCPRSFDRREVGKSTFGNMDHSVRTASQILSIMKPPAEVRISQSAPSGQAHSVASSVSRTAFDVNCRKNSVVDDSNRSFGGRETSGLSHFATQLRSSIQCCLNLETLPRKNSVRDHQWNESSGNNYSTYDDPNIRRPAAFEGLGLAMVDTLASNMPNAKGQKLDSSNQHSGSSSDNVLVMNIVTDTGFQDGGSGTADQPTTQNSSTDGTFDDPPSTSAYTLTCKDPKIQALIDDCPSFDLGF
ncbi:uncharacterized protein LOC110432243 isoform X2 [Sorghum bicolor]|uniref:uncharacterized protein LOC110432243 isoform X2 n=1 Tax=Sorghum bicolor TaxID=4558 RepID=UPI000B42644A|nr:uncharacterized protein LOC110432243 isoform X2 [Sorghum bicolor]|eukprot:XP_021307928.1 uncharacterized protein LOC110432243 isoform X2 [Sorghum bicolor]